MNYLRHSHEQALHLLSQTIPDKTSGTHANFRKFIAVTEYPPLLPPTFNVAKMLQTMVD